jgi:hypothetical protein
MTRTIARVVDEARKFADFNGGDLSPSLPPSAPMAWRRSKAPAQALAEGVFRRRDHQHLGSPPRAGAHPANLCAPSRTNSFSPQTERRPRKVTYGA